MCKDLGNSQPKTDLDKKEVRATKEYRLSSTGKAHNDKARLLGENRSGTAFPENLLLSDVAVPVTFSENYGSSRVDTTQDKSKKYSFLSLKTTL